MVEFEHKNLSGSRFHNLLMRNVRITGVWGDNLEIDAALEGPLTVNGVDVVPYVEELEQHLFTNRDLAVLEGRTWHRRTTSRSR